MLVFPGNKVDGKATINGARGFNRLICDRLDLTMECIRRHYLGEYSPLAETLERYRDFFELFQGFRGYAEFFLLQDLVTDDASEVRFFTDGFQGFSELPLPRDTFEYRTYMERSMAFINARNIRIQEWVEGRAGGSGPG